MSAPELTAERLRAILHYDPATGVFTWRSRSDVRKQWNTRYAGKQAGTPFKPDPGHVYWVINIDNVPRLAHRLAWLYVTGEWPEELIDHEDLDGLNNRWRNLRPATKAQNGANRPAQVNNACGFKGVRRSGKSRFGAAISVSGRQYWLGSFATPEEASAAYERAAALHYGEFGRAA